MSEGVMTHEECLAEAVAMGRIVVYPGPCDLLVDIDSEDQWFTFHRCMKVLAETDRGSGLQFMSNPSPSKRPYRFHVTVTLQKPVEPRERILLQACLGSDPLRELLSLQRLDAGNPHPTLFFELPMEAK